MSESDKDYTGWDLSMIKLEVETAKTLRRFVEDDVPIMESVSDELVEMWREADDLTVFASIYHFDGEESKWRIPVSVELTEEVFGEMLSGEWEYSFCRHCCEIGIDDGHECPGLRDYRKVQRIKKYYDKLMGVAVEEYRETGELPRRVLNGVEAS